MDPLDRLAQKDITDVTVDDLISALHVTPEEVSLLQTMTAGQRHNPLWMDVRQWRVTASNFGRVCNHHREPGYYPPSLLKLLLGDCSAPVAAPLHLIWKKGLPKLKKTHDLLSSHRAVGHNRSSDSELWRAW